MINRLLKYSLNTYLIALLTLGLVTEAANVNVVDIIGFQWYYLSFINLFGIFLVFFEVKFNKTPLNLKSFFMIKHNLFYAIFVLVSLVSILFSINQTASLITLSRILISFSTLIIFFILSQYRKINLMYLSLMFVAILCIEIYFSLNPFFKIIKQTEYQFYMASQYLTGITGNKNITSISIAFKIPFLYILYSILKKRKIIFLLITCIASAAYLNLIILSSRAILLSTFLCVLTIITFNFLSSFKNKTWKNFFKQISIYILPILIAFTISSYLINDENLKINNRINTISEDDTSASTRLRYYSQGINYFLSNPLIGCGIGNYQILSIKLDKENISSYIIPYVAHNDIIEVLVETGIFGGFSYFIFLILPSYYLIRSYFKSKSIEERELILYLFIPFIYYFIDANLNFPQYRPLVQFPFLVYILITFQYYKTQTKN